VVPDPAGHPGGVIPVVSMTIDLRPSGPGERWVGDGDLRLGIIFGPADAAPTLGGYLVE